MAERETKDLQIVVRLTSEMGERIDAYADRLRADVPGPVWSRSDVVRRLLVAALEAEEARTAKPKARR